MKKTLFLFTLLLAAVCVWATDVSLTETYQTCPYTGAQSERQSYEGDHFLMYLRGARSKSTDKLKDGTTKGVWMSRATNKSCYIETANEAVGGIKAISFKYCQFGAESDTRMYLSVKIDGTEQDALQFDAEATPTDKSYSQSFDVRKNTKLTIANLSYTASDPATVAQGRFIVGPITITPYLYYRQKHVTLGLHNIGYINHNLIDNTTEGAITYTSSNVSVAEVDSKTGAVTPVAEGTTTITAQWESVSVSYELTVDGSVIVEYFSQVEQPGSAPSDTRWDGEYTEWTVGGTRRGTNDTLANGCKGSWTSLDAVMQTSAIIEGGIKHLTFNWSQWGSEKTNTLKLTVAAGSYSNTVSVAGVASGKQELQSFDEDLNCTSNVQLSVTNTSEKVGSTACRVVIGDMIITPYLLYTQKKAIACQVAGAFTNTSLIDNTSGDPVVYTLEDNDEEAAIDANTGAVTVLKDGEVTVRATWGEVSTTYTLRLSTADKVETFNSSETTMTYRSSPATRPADIANWTYMLGGVVKTLDAFKGQNAIALKAPYDELGTEEAFIESSAISGGLSKLRFEWNLIGSETTTNWDIRFLVNGSIVKTLTNADITATDRMAENQIVTIDNLKIAGDFILRIENHSVIEGYTSGNKGRIAMDNFEFFGYENVALNETTDNSATLTAHDGETMDVVITRSDLVADAWNTLCLPFDINVSELSGAEVVGLTSASVVDDVLEVNFTAVAGTITAGTPVLVKPSSTLSLSAFTGRTISATPGSVNAGIISLYGIFSPFNVTANDQSILFLTAPDINGDNIHYASETASIKGFRAYFKLSDPSKAPGRARIAIHRTATLLDEIQSTIGSGKLIRDGQLLIVKGDQIFNAQGVRIQ